MPIIEPATIKSPLSGLVSDGFDFGHFSTAVNQNPIFSQEQKTAILQHFSPDRPLALTVENAGAGLNAFLNHGMEYSPAAMRQMPQPKHVATLPKEHPVAQMWNEVWTQTLDRYAAPVANHVFKSAEYKDTGKIPFDQYPLNTPPIFVHQGEKALNAFAGALGAEHSIGAMVTEGFLGLPPEEQRAILLHEAQHAIEPVLLKQSPEKLFTETFPKLHKLTSNASSRHFENRADSHSARMGEGGPMQAALGRIEQQATAQTTHRAAVMEHLHKSGFAFDGDKVEARAIEACNARGAAIQSAGLPPEQPDIPHIRETAQLGAAANNRVIAMEGAVPQEKGLGKIIHNLRQNLHSTHPQTDKRINRIARLEARFSGSQNIAKPPATPPMPKINNSPDHQR